MALQTGKSTTKPASGSDVSTVPGIYVEGESYEKQNEGKSRNRSEKRDSTLSTSLDALTASSNSVFSQENVINDDVMYCEKPKPDVESQGAVVNEFACRDRDIQRTEEDALLPLGAYCSPRLNRRQRSGSYPIRDHRYPIRDLSSLRADGYLKFKNKSGRSRVNSGESRESGDTLDNVSHLSTCATSDYAFMTSLDTLNLCRSCTSMNVEAPHNHDNRGRPLSLDVEMYTGIRRTHSNPENCQLDSKDITDLDDNQYGTLKGSKRGFDDVKENTMTLKPQSTSKGSAQDDSGIFLEHMEKLKRIDLDDSKGNVLEDILTSRGRKKGSKAIATSEENLVSRVSRWLSTMEQPETRDIDTF